jgi:hypothetical protein
MRRPCAAPRAPARAHAPALTPTLPPSAAQDLHAAATGANLRAEGVLGQALGLFDTNLELWSGRLAMIGILGTLVVEGVTGNTIL